MMDASSTPAASADSDQHVTAHVKQYQALVGVLSTSSPAFSAWEAANKEYERVVASTGWVGTNTGKRDDALHQARMARLAYLAPLAVATEQARVVAGHPPLLSPEDWVELAFHQDPSLLVLQGKSSTEFKQAVDAAVQKLKDAHNQYDGVISVQQLAKGQELTQRQRGSFSAMIERGANWVFGRRNRSSTEKAEYSNATDADITPEHLDRLMTAQALRNLRSEDPQYDEKSDGDKQRLLQEAIDTLKKNDAEIKKQAKDEINQHRAQLRSELDFARRAYGAAVTDMTVFMESALNALTVFKNDVEAHNKNNPSAPQIEMATFLDIADTATAVRLAEERAILANFHEHARRYEEQFVKAGKMGRYDAEMTTSHRPVGKEQSDKLEMITGNAARKKKGESMLVNGIPCENAGFANMYDMQIGTCFLGITWGAGKRTQHIGKFFEGWMVETAAANNDAYQKILAQNNEKPTPLSVVQMLEAYSNKEDPSNQNMVGNQPINMLHITSFPVHNGVESTLQALAEMMAMAKILGVAINIDMDAIVHNAASTDQGMAKRIQYQMLKYMGPNDATYYQPALERVRKTYDLTGTEDVQRAQLIERLTGKGRAVDRAAMTIRDASGENRGIPAMDVSGTPSSSSEEVVSPPVEKVASPVAEVVVGGGAPGAAPAPTLVFVPGTPGAGITRR